MAQRIYIKVVGFSDEERHALNTVFRLSEQCRTMYQLWTPEAGETARVALLDGQSWEARVEAESPLQRDLPLLWVGPDAPASAWRAFERPMAWPEIIETLDALFAPDDALDLDLDLGAGTEVVMSQKQALIVSAERDERLYLRARLALSRLTLADEAENAVQAVEMARGKHYDLALVDAGLPDMDPWILLRQLQRGHRPVAHVAIARAAGSLTQRLRAWRANAALLQHPPHGGRLDAWLSRIERGAAG